ncbi:MAG: hypothetical protein WBA61_11820 [Aequorivita sp.]
MMKIITIMLLFIVAFTSEAQDIAIQWQKTVGGGDRDDLNDINPTADGGYIIGGTSLSNISGEKTENSNGDRDIWVVKTNETGSIEWQISYLKESQARPEFIL